MKVLVADGDPGRSTSVGYSAFVSLAVIALVTLLMIPLREDAFGGTSASYIADLLAAVWGPAYRTELEYVRIYVRRLPAKLERLGLPEAIKSRPGLCYKLEVT